MSSDLPVFWGEGLFLQAQHFQQEAHAFDSKLAALGAQVVGPLPGWFSLRSDDRQVAQGRFSLLAAEFALHTGQLVRIPEQCDAPPVFNLPNPAQKPPVLVLYLALAAHSTVGLEEAGETGSDRQRKYRVEVSSLPDMAGQTAALDVALLKMRAFWTTQPDASAHQYLIACARFKSDGFRWALDERFIAPVLRIGASASLMSGLKALHLALADKCRSLRQRLSLNQTNMAGNDPWGQQSRAMLQHMALALHPLGHALARGQASPESVYLDLLRLWGALSCFSEAGLEETPPGFDGSQLGECFTDLLSGLQKALTQAEDQRIHLPPLSVVKPGLWVAELSADLDENQFDFYLALQSAHSQADWVASVPVRVKLGSIDDVNRLLHSALPGVPLLHSAAAPGSLPVLVGRHYFSLEKGNELFKRMLLHRRLFIYCPPSFEDLQLELILVKRGLS